MKEQQRFSIAIKYRNIKAHETQAMHYMFLEWIPAGVAIDWSLDSVHAPILLSGTIAGARSPIGCLPVCKFCIGQDCSGMDVRTTV